MAVSRKGPNRLPKAQGSLDRLCGIYSIINAIGLMHSGFEERHAGELFLILKDRLHDGDRLQSALGEGITVRPLGDLIDTAATWLENETGASLSRRLAFGRDPVALGLYWSRVRAHIKANGPGSAIVGISGIHDHWTCIKTMTETTIGLHDSDGLHRMLRRACTTYEAMGRRRHVMWPTQTFLLSMGRR